MSANTPIEWTDRTWNPVRGCSRVSAGCGGPNHEGGCYAEKIAARFSDPGQAYHGLAERTPHGGRWTGEIALVESALDQPLRWKRPRRIFVNSMSDLFHEKIDDKAIDMIFAVMALAPQHTFQVLTKRAERMRAYLKSRDGMGNAALCKAINDIPAKIGNRHGALEMPLPNVWLGVSVEDQDAADGRIPQLLATPAAVRFLSCEPLLGLVNLTWLGHDGDGVIDALRGEDWIENWLNNEGTKRKRQVVARRNRLDWVICGGESGLRKRPTDVAWHRSLRDQCAAAGVPFFEKQIDKKQPIPDDLMIREFPKVTP